jgi:pimeloyl-ACP methyl ester carboxylesterase
MVTFRKKRSFSALTKTFGAFSSKAGEITTRLVNREWGHVKKIFLGLGDEAAAILISLNLYPLGLVNLEKLEVLSSVVPKRPILLIHGYFHNNSVFYILKRRLYREGWKHVYSINLKTYARGIEESAHDISKKVADILKDTGAEKVDIIGHSLGGLCARYYVQALEGEEKIGNCITIGTPHQGSHLAFFGFGPANLDMQPGSDLLKQINDELSLPPQVQFTNIWSSFDYMVIPIENAIMEGRVRNIQIDFVGHMGLLFSRKVFNEIFLTLSSDFIHRKLAPKRKYQQTQAKKKPFSQAEEKSVSLLQKSR